MCSAFDSAKVTPPSPPSCCFAICRLKSDRSSAVTCSILKLLCRKKRPAFCRWQRGKPPPGRGDATQRAVEITEGGVGYVSRIELVWRVGSGGFHQFFFPATWRKLRRSYVSLRILNWRQKIHERVACAYTMIVFCCCTGMAVIARACYNSYIAQCGQ